MCKLFSNDPLSICEGDARMGHQRRKKQRVDSHALALELSSRTATAALFRHEGCASPWRLFALQPYAQSINATFCASSASKIKDLLTVRNPEDALQLQEVMGQSYRKKTELTGEVSMT